MITHQFFLLLGTHGLLLCLFLISNIFQDETEKAQLGCRTFSVRTGGQPISLSPQAFTHGILSLADARCRD
ncbi:hypothetical protein [Rhizobium sp. L74/93]